MVGRGLLQPRWRLPGGWSFATRTSFLKGREDLMLQAFIITLREGVEASLIVGIVFAYLTKIGRHELKRTVFWALGAALAASVAGAVILARLQLNTDIFEGWVMLAAAFFVISMIWFMHRAAR